MKKSTTLITAALSLALSAAPGFAAEPAAAPSQGRPSPEARAQFRAQKLETLHSALKLTPAQESAWTAWTGKLKPDFAAWKALRGEDWANMTVITRMEKKLEFAKQRISHLEDKLAATKTFYAALTEDQRKVFDKEFVFHGRGEGFGHGRGHGRWHEEAE